MTTETLPRIQPRPVRRTGHLNRAQRNTVRTALATAATIAALIGAQALAVLDRSADTKPVQIVPPGAANATRTPTKTKPKPKPTATTTPSLDLSGDDGSNSDDSGAPSLDLSGGDVQPAPIQPTPFTLTS